MKPELTQEQKDSIKEQFNELVAQMPKETQELWNKEGSLLIVGDILTINPTGFQGKFHGKLADEFHKLLLKNGIII